MAAPFEVWFYSVPPVTRAYLVTTTLTTLACVRHRQREKVSE
jgi:hypothetical protein